MNINEKNDWAYRLALLRRKTRHLSRASSFHSSTTSCRVGLSAPCFCPLPVCWLCRTRSVPETITICSYLSRFLPLSSVWSLAVIAESAQHPSTKHGSFKKRTRMDHPLCNDAGVRSKCGQVHNTEGKINPLERKDSNEKEREQHRRKMVSSMSFVFEASDSMRGVVCSGSAKNENSFRPRCTPPLF